MNYLLMEMTQLTDRVDVLENQSKDGIGETKSHSDVNIEFHGPVGLNHGK